MKKHRPPGYMRAQQDLVYSLNGQSLELLEIRPVRGHPDKRAEISQAKATYVKQSNTWQIHWLRQNEEWRRYKPALEVNRLEEFFALMEEGVLSGFRG